MAGKPKKGARRARPRTAATGVTGPVMALPKQVLDVHRFKRSGPTASLAAAAADKGWAWSFALSDTANYTELTSLFDQYRIRQVDMVFRLDRMTSSASQAYPTIWILADYDSASAPGSLDEVAQRPYKSFQFGPTNTTVSFTLKPRLLADAGIGGSAAYSVLVPREQWIDAASATLTHYGAIAWISNYNTGIAGLSLSLQETIHVECCSVR